MQEAAVLVVLPAREVKEERSICLPAQVEIQPARGLAGAIQAVIRGMASVLDQAVKENKPVLASIPVIAPEDEYTELDAASNNRVDDMRELLPRVYTAPSDLRHKVFIIDEVQRIKEGWDVLLKTLEEPPPDVLFIFCTTDPSGIRPAVVSRLQRFTFRPLPENKIRGKLRRIAEAEGRTISDDALKRDIKRDYPDIDWVKRL